MNKYILALLMFNLIMSKNLNLWDLGVSINNNKTKTHDIKPLISDTQIIPDYNKDLNIPKFNISKSNLSEDHIIKILYCSDKYAELVQYLNDKKSILSDQYRLIHADALYRLGKYQEAMSSLSAVSDEYPIDEKYFLFAIYNKKAGDLALTTQYLNKLIEQYPNSEYYKLAKLQIKTLK